LDLGHTGRVCLGGPISKNARGGYAFKCANRQSYGGEESKGEIECKTNEWKNLGTSGLERVVLVRRGGKQ